MVFRVATALFFKFRFGFHLGDPVKAVVIKGKKRRVYIGKIVTSASGSFNISTEQGLVQGIKHKTCKHVHPKDDYSVIATASGLGRYIIRTYALTGNTKYEVWVWGIQT